ncbi:MAG: WD40 repeat domain-containing protein, partial [Candidatus Omnitrophota bacterium]
ALIWDSKTGEIEFKAKFIEGLIPNGIDTIAFSPDGKNIAIASPMGISIWDIASNKMIKEFDPKHPATYRMEYLSDGKRIVAYPGYFIYVLSINGDLLAQYTSEGYVSLSKDGKYLRTIIGDIDGIPGKYEYRIEDVDTNKRVSTYTFNAKKGSIFMSPDGQYILAASENSSEGIGIRKVGALDSAMRSFSLEANVDYAYMKVAFSDDNKKFACMIDTKAYIYDISDITSVIKESTAQ